MSVELANRFSRTWVQHFQASEDTVVCGPGALALLVALLAGATGPAEDELSQAVGLSRAEAAATFDEIASVVERVPGLSWASGVWARSDVSVRPSYVSSFPRLTVAELQDDQAILDRWATESTNGQITTFPAQVNSDTRLAAATAVAADVEWVDPFVGGLGMGWNSTDRRYTKLNRWTTSLDDAAIIEGGAVISRVSCATTVDFDVQIVAGEPDATPATVVGTALDALAGEADVRPGTALSLGDTGGCLQVTEVRSFDSRPELYVGVPAFEVSAFHDLLDSPDLFGLDTVTDAQFGHFPHLAVEPLAIEAAAQASMVAFSDRGFRAAAVTAAMAVAGGIPPETKRIVQVDHDRPFGFLAVDRRSGLVVFAGWVHEVDPVAEFDIAPL